MYVPVVQTTKIASFFGGSNCGLKIHKNWR